MQLSSNEKHASLSEYLRQHFPALASANIEFDEETDDYFVLRAPLAHNHNDLQTAFGGSLYNLALMSCWSTLYLACSGRIAQPRIVTRDAQMRYRHPVADSIIRASCRKPNSRQWDGFFAHYDTAGRTSITLTSSIIIAEGTAAYFDGVFVLLERDG
ncbi:MAG: YiiD C-terminal domain-containing protein [Pseudomonadales bacterium]